MKGIVTCTVHCTYIITITNRSNRLTWHDGRIPFNEVWIKLGGDKGGSSFKMNFQILNVTNPNSVDNTCVFVAYQAGDSVHNLHIALDRYKDQVKDLQESEWKYARRIMIM